MKKKENKQDNKKDSNQENYKDGYKNISSFTNRSQLPLSEDISNLKINEDRPQQKEFIAPITQFKPVEINLKATHLNMKPFVLQNPHMQMYNSFTNYSVCPFCKYSGSMEIRFKTSQKQKSCCCLLSITGLILCAWIPFIVKDCADQVYTCPQCNEVLKTLPANKVNF